MATAPVPGKRGRFAAFNIGPTVILPALTNACIRAAVRRRGLVRLPVPGRRAYWVVSDPEHVRRVLVTNAENYDKAGPLYGVIASAGGEGLFTVNDPALWRMLRQLMGPAFQRSSMPTVAELSSRLWQRRMARFDPGRPVDFFNEFKQLGIETLVEYLFGETADSGRIARLAQSVFEGMAGQLFLPRWMPGTARYARAIAAFDDLVYSMIRARRSSSVPRDDLLGYLVFASDPQTGTGLTDRQVRDQVFTLFMAGFDSTATVLAWAVTYLARDPPSFGRLRAEVLGVVGGRPPTLADTADLPRLRAFWQTVLHYQPAFRIFFRNVVGADRLGDAAVSPGDQLMISPYATHRDPRYFPGARQFDPDLLAHPLTPRERSAHLPFGQGRRKCPGEEMAYATGVLPLAMLLQRCDALRLPSLNGGLRNRYAMTSPPLSSRVRVTLHG
jgi:cytochrome P450